MAEHKQEVNFNRRSQLFAFASMLLVRGMNFNIVFFAVPPKGNAEAVGGYVSLTFKSRAEQNAFNMLLSSFKEKVICAKK